ncbi:MAG: YeeE/YedE family protein [Burkholderiaceae bacterium]
MAEVNLAAINSTVLWGGLAVGAALGAAMQRFHFCTMGAVADIINFGDWSRMRMWLIAIAVGILGVAGMTAAGFIAPAKSLYGGNQVLWLSSIVGGTLFGMGMVLAGGCGSRTLTRLGAGNLKALVVFLVLGIVAYMTMKGVLGVLRVNTLDHAAIAVKSQSLIATVGPWLGVFAAAALLIFVFMRAEGRRADVWLGGLIIGLLVGAAWFVSGKLGYVAEDPNTLEEVFVGTNSGRMEALSFVAPVAYILDLLMLWSDKSRVVTFGITVALGMIVGAAAYALITRTFRWEGFTNTEDLVNHIVGGALMGFGGVLAGGCTVGQGLSGMSVLSIGALLTFVSIIGGAWLALGYQTRRLEAMA